jgi:hypothetical protein
VASEFAGIVVGHDDSAGRRIIDVYTCAGQRYAIYRTRERVIILYAEDPLVQRAQRRRLSALAPIRSRIDSDLADWRGRDSRFSRLPATARQYDEQVVGALKEALDCDPQDGNSSNALEILQGVLADITAEKASRARLSYLLWSYATAAVLLVVCCAIYGVMGGFERLDAMSIRSLMHAVLAGVAGTIYSMSLGIQQRAMRNDQRRLDHFTDAMVRISIGALAAFIIETFLLSGAISIGFGNGAALSAAKAADPSGIHPTNWPIEVIAGFLAGFAERLVPDLLNSYTTKGQAVEAPSSKPASTGAVPAATPAATATVTAAAEPDVETPEATSADDDVDGCASDHADPGPGTSDEDLPPASGGGEKE